MKKYDTQFKLQVVKSYLAEDGGAKLLARRWSVPEDKVRTWVLHFQWHGIAGLQPKYSRYSEQFKQQVLAHQDREQLSNRQIAAIYDIRNCNQVAVWRRKLLPSDGAGADIEDNPKMTDTRDHPPEMPADLDDDERTRALVQENERLRADVAYLKKLHALIRAKQSAAPTRCASSSD